MLKPSDRQHALKTKRKYCFNREGYQYEGTGIGFFRRHRGMKCGGHGCKICHIEAQLKRERIKIARVVSRKILVRELGDAKE